MILQRIVVVGAGGFAREVRWLIEEINRAASTRTFQFLGYVVSDLARVSEHDSVAEILGDYRWLDEHAHEVDALTIGIGTPGARLRVGADLSRRLPKLAWPLLVHPTAIFDRGTCHLGDGTIVCAGVNGTVNVTLEPFAMVNLACTLGHEAVVRGGAVLNPTVNISGGVEVGKGVLVGTGAQILQYVRIGDGATIGAGAVVTKNVPPGETWIGVPAKPLKKP